MQATQQIGKSCSQILPGKDFIFPSILRQLVPQRREPPKEVRNAQNYSEVELPRWLSGKESACSAGGTGSVPGSGRSPGGENGNPLQYFGLENSMNRGTWWATVYGIAESAMIETSHDGLPLSNAKELLIKTRRMNLKNYAE